LFNGFIGIFCVFLFVLEKLSGSLFAISIFGLLKSGVFHC
jgi:hypothetical protein